VTCIGYNETQALSADGFNCRPIGYIINSHVKRASHLCRYVWSGDRMKSPGHTQPHIIKNGPLIYCFRCMVTSPPRGVQSMWWVCRLVCLSIYSHISKTTCTAKLHQILGACCPWPWIGPLWRRYDTLRRPTSGFVNDVIFSHWPNGSIARHSLCIPIFPKWR